LSGGCRTVEWGLPHVGTGLALSLGPSEGPGPGGRAPGNWTAGVPSPRRGLRPSV